VNFETYVSIRLGLEHGIGYGVCVHQLEFAEALERVPFAASSSSSGRAGADIVGPADVFAGAMYRATWREIPITKSGVVPSVGGCERQRVSVGHTEPDRPPEP